MLLTTSTQSTSGSHILLPIHPHIFAYSHIQFAASTFRLSFAHFFFWPHSRFLPTSTFWEVLQFTRLTTFTSHSPVPSLCSSNHSRVFISITTFYMLLLNIPTYLLTMVTFHVLHPPSGSHFQTPHPNPTQVQ